MPFGGGSVGSRSLISPLIIRAPSLVTKPLRLSDRCDDMTSVDGWSDGASSADTSSRPAFREWSVSWRDESSHSSSLAWTVIRWMYWHYKIPLPGKFLPLWSIHRERWEATQQLTYWAALAPRACGNDLDRWRQQQSIVTGMGGRGLAAVDMSSHPIMSRENQTSALFVVMATRSKTWTPEVCLTFFTIMH
jgi:hypothetical protein